MWSNRISTTLRYVYVSLLTYQYLVDLSTITLYIFLLLLQVTQVWWWLDDITKLKHCYRQLLTLTCGEIPEFWRPSLEHPLSGRPATILGIRLYISLFNFSIVLLCEETIQKFPRQSFTIHDPSSWQIFYAYCSLTVAARVWLMVLERKTGNNTLPVPVCAIACHQSSGWK